MRVVLGRPDPARKGSSTVLSSWRSDTLSGTQEMFFFFSSISHVLPLKVMFQRLNEEHPHPVLEGSNQQSNRVFYPTGRQGLHLESHFEDFGLLGHKTRLEFSSRGLGWSMPHLNNLGSLREFKGTDPPSSHLSEVDAGDKIIRTLFTGHRGHLDQSIINRASFRGPVFFTQHLHANTYKYLIIHSSDFC